ncbi:hypothetical protein HYW36_01265 [Candidatus Saccharibacteria bacterium]|nr:hypothetical protein [Candidatus Saccharibacteria bacterium]
MAKVNISNLKLAAAKKARDPKDLTIGILTLAAIIAIGLIGGNYYNKYQDSQNEVKRLTADPQEAAKAQLKDVVAKVGALTELPKDETPTLATVADPDKLKDQPFFANTQKGDQALIYTQAKKAYLYRPSTNKLLEIAPINIGAPAERN